MSEITKALIKAKANFGAIKRTAIVKVTTKSGGSYTFKYAPMDEMKTATEKPLAKEGLVVVFTRDGDVLVTSLLHTSGERIESRSNMRIKDGLSQQEEGGIRTYQERYNYAGILGLSICDDDDGNIADGNSVEHKSKPSSKPAPKAEAPNKTAGKPNGSDIAWMKIMRQHKEALGLQYYDILGTHGFEHSNEVEMGLDSKAPKPKRKAIDAHMKDQIAENVKAKFEGREVAR